MSAAAGKQSLNHIEQMKVKKRRIWELATSPRKQMGMMMFMMWLSGNDLNIFPIIITAQAVYSPISSIMGAQKLFSKVVDGIDQSTELQEERRNAVITYILHQIVFFAMGLVKCYYLGLVPTHALDWIDHRPFAPVEMSAGFAM
eukprot:TRINITY_DN5593_c0_g1_i1.p1 TRINITY_DN5593_c0_g1~~TRINITY_DN5593_c0_g1_i1.p1  ORF type:complete len:168 (+),score=21.47 TRINITY_DN5593_c0_g1_i1:73-504(+)